KDPQRIVFDIKDTIMKVMTPPQSNGTTIKGIRFSQESIDPLVSRVVITLAGTTYKTYLSKDKKKLAVIIKEKTNAVKPEKPYPLKGRTIALDPGHGGKDPGTIGYSGTFEKHLTIKPALRLCELLYNGGANVVLTKEKDTYVNNKDIVNLANRNDSDAFISLHYNSYKSPQVAGTETYYFTKQSIALAKIIQKRVVQAVKRRKRKIKKVTYYTIHHTKMPAVILEAMYISNPTEERLAKSLKYQNLIAAGIYRGIKEYFLKYKEL
ncbi:N-acetylmuramoyl-L-alanine amidase, partial [Candidatus Margulisiibacteriota bacterium]